MVIGIDQSYKNTGVSIAVDGELKKVSSIDLKKLKSNSERRNKLEKKIKRIIEININKTKKLEIIIERIRLNSRGFISVNYIKSMGALDACIIDVAAQYGIKVYSVDTRSWKAQVIGTSKPKNNKYGVPAEKWPTVEFVIDKGFESSIKKEVKGRRKSNTFVENEVKYEYDNDAADSAGIALYGFIDERKQKLNEEK